MLTHFFKKKQCERGLDNQNEREREYERVRVSEREGELLKVMNRYRFKMSPRVAMAFDH